MSVRRAQARQRRESLLDAALAVFADKGVDGASVKDIAAAAGVTPGLLYHYFPSKEGLLVTMLAERGFMPELRERLRVGHQRPAREVLVELATGFGRMLADRADLVRLFLSGAATDPRIREQLTALVAEGQHLLADYLATRVETGELRPHDTVTAAQMLLSAIVLGQVTDRVPDAAVLVELILHGLIASTSTTSQSPPARN
ncbi:MAG: TetR/AcrR family transcriptional regulator [Kutzneria sp.]|nr:TetR/AcrR family transcriptional regulator [Kutzneria sp.]MBV9845083.1 TetR/AcrR family transcriptional regulator [Kutzneria sp.]